MRVHVRQPNFYTLIAGISSKPRLVICVPSAVWQSPTLASVHAVAAGLCSLGHLVLLRSGKVVASVKDPELVKKIHAIGTGFVIFHSWTTPFYEVVDVISRHWVARNTPALTVMYDVTAGPDWFRIPR